MSYLVNLVLDGRPVVVVGGGEVAARKVADLLAAKASVTVVALEPCEKIRALASERRLRGEWRAYRAGDLEGAFLAIAALDDDAVNAEVAREASARGVLVNVVDRPALCTFTVPATMHRGDLTVAVATEGRSPALAGVLREEIEERYGAEYAELVRLFGELRTRMIALDWDGYHIREMLAQLYRGGIVERIATGDQARLKEFLASHLGPDFPLPE
jgi:precorrin-2 dehydrogenase/sirohydrochlorin ferrochelatase